MKNFSTWLLIMFAVMFWAFRIVVILMAQMGMDFGGIIPLNENLEIILSFVVLASFILIAKRKMIGSLIYLLAYGIYFGVDLFNNGMAMIEASQTLGVIAYVNTFISLIGIILPIAILLDTLVDKNRKLNPKDKKTDWFFKNKDYDRKLDERSDKNNYRTM